MKRFLLSIAITGIVASSVLAQHSRSTGGSKGNHPQPAHTGQTGHSVAPARPFCPPSHNHPQPAKPQIPHPVPSGKPHVQPGHSSKPSSQNPNWGKAGNKLGIQSPTGWHAQSNKGNVIAKNYPHRSKNWWSAKWGVCLRFDPTTGGYYFYLNTFGCYVAMEHITTYYQPLETPIAVPTTEPDQVPGDPPDPVEP